LAGKLIEYTSENGVATIALNRTDKRNAISIPMAEELRDCFLRFDAGDDRAAVLCSNDEKIFCAGADLNEPPEMVWQAIPEIGFRTNKPIVAAVNKRAIGVSVVLIAMCDFLVVSEETVIHYPEAQLGFSGGLITGAVKRMPMRLANELILIGDPISGRRAYETGFANRIVEPGREREEALAMARRLADNAPLVVTGSKRMIIEAAGRTPMELQYELQRESDRMMHSEDADRGLEAWRNKTKPVFFGR
jgi:enoyl-CoA hydratase